MTVLPGVALIAICLVLVGYAYVAYPVILRLLPRRDARIASGSPGHEDWPPVSITVPVYNEERTIAGTLERLLALDYPRGRKQILVVSDASNDRTEEIVRSYAERGVELATLPQRGGKTAAENAAGLYIRGDIVVNTDASVGLDPSSLKPLVAALRNPMVGVASGRDVSVARIGDGANLGESGYVGYEMWLRELETAAGGIVGASGCFYAIRRELHGEVVPDELSRDFAAPLIAHEHGYRSVSVRDAVCFVPRTPSLRREYHRKVRTMSRGLQTLYYWRHLMDPISHGRFAWMLVSHKLVRWLVPWAMLMGVFGGVLLELAIPILRVPVSAGLALGASVAVLGWFLPPSKLPRPIAVSAYVIWGLIAGIRAWIVALRGDITRLWEPTRREVIDPT